MSQGHRIAVKLGEIQRRLAHFELEGGLDGTGFVYHRVSFY